MPQALCKDMSLVTAVLFHELELDDSKMLECSICEGSEVEMKSVNFVVGLLACRRLVEVEMKRGLTSREFKGKKRMVKIMVRTHTNHSVLKYS